MQYYILFHAFKKIAFFNKKICYNSSIIIRKTSNKQRRG